MFKLNHYFIILFLIFGFTIRAYSASFDCGKATTLIEKAICNDSKLSDLDELLMQSYKKALANSTDSDAIKSQQKEWLKNVRNKCQDSECIKRVYEERISSLNSKTNLSNPVSDNADSLWQGEWKRINCSKNEGAGLTITKKTSKGFNFLIDAASGANVGQIEGTASFTQKDAVYKDPGSGCVVEFKVKDKCIEIKTTEGCSGFGGMGVYFDGTYCNVERQTKQISNHLIDIGVFRDNAGVDAFKKTVGNNYGLFEESFQLSNEEKDLDNLDAKVFSGGVRGLFTIQEGIIMYSANGRIYAAVIDGDIVNFFQ